MTLFSSSLTVAQASLSAVVKPSWLSSLILFVCQLAWSTPWSKYEEKKNCKVVKVYIGAESFIAIEFFIRTWFHEFFWWRVLIILVLNMKTSKKFVKSHADENPMRLQSATLHWGRVFYRNWTVYPFVIFLRLLLWRVLF